MAYGVAVRGGCFGNGTFLFRCFVNIDEKLIGGHIKNNFGNIPGILSV